MGVSKEPDVVEMDKAQRIIEPENTTIPPTNVHSEIDSRSIYVGNVDYQCTPENLEDCFSEVGEVERVTIAFDKFSGLPKGYAYILFKNSESVSEAIEKKTGFELKGRELRVTEKRTNIPGFNKRGRGGGRARGRGRGRGRRRGRG